jgi:hypothetical protein
VDGLTYNNDTKKISVDWRDDNKLSMSTKSKDFDYAVVAVPFSKVRLWRTPRKYPLLTQFLLGSL